MFSLTLYRDGESDNRAGEALRPAGAQTDKVDDNR